MLALPAGEAAAGAFATWFCAPNETSRTAVTTTAASVALFIPSLLVAPPEQKQKVYNLYIMRRTQIYLTQEQGRLLAGQSKATGHTISQLIRAAIDSAYSRRRRMSCADRVRLARRTAGAWSDFPESGADYVERIRGARRLARLRGAG